MISISKFLDVGCGDNSCRWGSPGGVGTNGGCRCAGEKDSRPKDKAEMDARLAKHQGIVLLRQVAELPGVAAALEDLVRMVREGRR